MNAYSIRLTRLEKTIEREFRVLARSVFTDAAWQWLMDSGFTKQIRLIPDMANGIHATIWNDKTNTALRIKIFNQGYARRDAEVAIHSGYWHDGSWAFDDGPEVQHFSLEVSQGRAFSLWHCEELFAIQRQNLLTKPALYPEGWNRNHGWRKHR